jgi:alpha-ketoglutarate-dependent 2,4-dichlorophenoxyacetate dioxygenase
MARYTLTPLTPHFGVEVSGIDLNEVTGDTLFPDIRALFEEHSALLFRGQAMTEETHFRLAELFGPLEDRYPEDRKPGEKMKIPTVSNVDEDGWRARRDGPQDGEPAGQFPVAYRQHLPAGAGAGEHPDGQDRALLRRRDRICQHPRGLGRDARGAEGARRGRGMWHNASQSRKRINEELSKWPMFHKWPPQHWKSVWTNPVNGREALYIASHVFRSTAMTRRRASRFSMNWSPSAPSRTSSIRTTGRWATCCSGTSAP